MVNMEPMGPQLIVPNRTETESTHGAWNFVMASRRANPRNHHIGPYIPSLSFDSGRNVFVIVTPEALIADTSRFNPIGNLFSEIRL